MRLVTFRFQDSIPHIGIVRDQQIIDLSAWMALDLTFPWLDLVDLIAMGEQGIERARTAFDATDSELRDVSALLALSDVQLLAPIPRPRKNVLCLGRNYAEHAAESAQAFGQGQPEGRPAHPVIFTKAVTSVIGPYDDIPYDANVSTEIDWEAELAVIIGRQGKNISREDALEYVFGYMVLNDISARDIQRRHGNQFFKGKSLDGSCPTGPWIVTADEIADPNNLDLYTQVNGTEKQRDNTHSMMWDVQAIIEVLSLGMTLEPGDIIATGTPAGVGFARNPPEFLQPGDVVECVIEKIGSIKNTVRQV